MNPGTLAIFTLLGTIGAGVVIMFYRDLIFDAPPARRQVRGRRPVRRRAAPAGRAKPAATEAKINAMISDAVSGAAMPENDIEMIALRTIARLIHANMITETTALQTVFGVRAGSGKDYKRVQAKLKIAQADVLKALEAEPLPTRNR